MSVTLTCDAPNCSLIVPAIVLVGRPAAPNGWMLQCTSEGRIVVGCCDEHFIQATTVVPR